MFLYVKRILIVIFEVFCCKIFYESFEKKRYENQHLLLVIPYLFLCCCEYVLAVAFSTCLLTRQLAYIAVISVIMCWMIKVSYLKSLVLAMLYESLKLMADYMAFSMNRKWLAHHNVMQEYHVAESAVVVFLGEVLLLFCILIIKKDFRKKCKEMLRDSGWVRFLFFPILTLFSISVMLTTFKNLETSKQVDVRLAIAFGIAGMNIVIFYLIHDRMERERQIHINNLISLQVKSQIGMYHSISMKYEDQKRKTHEYKNQIICIESLLVKKEYAELERYVKSIYGSLNKELDAINTNHAIVNAILNTKYQEAVEKGIVFVFRVNDLSGLKISDVDIVTILSNLLNNAIEACEKCSNKRIIRFKFFKTSHMVIIAVKNTFQHSLVYKHGELQSTKRSNAEEHGVGIKNIIRIINKYGGSYIMQEHNGEFYFSIMIPSGKDVF